jgi:hypothetical protein
VIGDSSFHRRANLQGLVDEPRQYQTYYSSFRKSFNGPSINWFGRQPFINLSNNRASAAESPTLPATPTWEPATASTASPANQMSSHRIPFGASLSAQSTRETARQYSSRNSAESDCPFSHSLNFADCSTSL